MKEKDTSKSADKKKSDNKKDGKQIKGIVDQLFKKKKIQKTEKKNDVKEPSKDKKSKSKPMAKVISMPKEFKSSNSDSKGIRKTEDGLRIYTEDELGLNKPGAGETDDCPFDCDCCF